jgi:4-amino-4-deoxy-L-arabinose transferase-like glycosyltransferase
VWGHLNPTATVHDEASYLLQARIFADGAFAMPAAPLPEFFEQFHTFVTPFQASKYPPGHALLLAPGAFVGWPALVPLLLGGVTAAFIFLLARRVSNAWVALLAWTIWLFNSATFHTHASYFSQTTSGALWVLGWWCLLEWRDTGRRGWLLALAACVGWLAITRPLTAAAYALPIGVYVSVRVARRKLWTDLAAAAALGTAILLILPYSNARTTGDWRRTPWSEYAREYLPFDRMGFGLDSTPPARALPPDMVQLGDAFKPLHVEYAPANVPDAFSDRMLYTSLELWRGPRVVLMAAALVGLTLAAGEVAFALASVVVVFAFYLVYAHPASWTLYYSETRPVIAMLSALGVWRLFSLRHKGRWNALPPVTAPAAVAAGLLLLAYLPSAVRGVGAWRRERVSEQQYIRSFQSTVARIPAPKAVVYVRYAPWHNVHTSLIANDPDLERARVWIVYDRGPDNVRLMKLAPDRVAYLFDEERYRFFRYHLTVAAAR